MTIHRRRTTRRTGSKAKKSGRRATHRSVAPRRQTSAIGTYASIVPIGYRPRVRDDHASSGLGPLPAPRTLGGYYPEGITTTRMSSYCPQGKITCGSYQIQTPQSNGIY